MNKYFCRYENIVKLGRKIDLCALFNNKYLSALTQFIIVRCFFSKADELNKGSS